MHVFSTVPSLSTFMRANLSRKKVYGEWNGYHFYVLLIVFTFLLHAFMNFYIFTWRNPNSEVFRPQICIISVVLFLAMLSMYLLRTLT